MPRKKKDVTVVEAQEVKQVNERTRIITAKITIIDKDYKKKKEPATKKELIAHLEGKLKKTLKADNVSISKVQDFILGE